MTNYARAVLLLVILTELALERVRSSLVRTRVVSAVEGVLRAAMRVPGWVS